MTALIGCSLLPGNSSAVAPVQNEYSVTGLSQPVELTTGADGNIWFSESSGNKIGRMNPSGSVTGEWIIPSFAAGPTGVTEGPDGNVWFTEYVANKIGKITTSGAITEYTIPASGAQAAAITPGPDGNLWFTESAVGRVGRITPTGSITEFTLPSSSSQPIGIIAGPDGNIWVAEATANKIAKLPTSGGPITEYATGAKPWDIASGPDGALWYTELDGNKVARISTAGSISEYAVPTPGAQPYGIISGPDGALWFSEQSAARIGRITTDGLTVQDWPLSPGSKAQGITNGPDGRIWVAEKVGDRLAASSMLAPAAATLGSAPLDTSSATLTGSLNPDGQVSSWHFEYGTSVSYGSQTAAQTTAASNATQTVSSSVGGLASGTTYHYRLVATGAAGTTYGSDATLTTATVPATSVFTPPAVTAPPRNPTRAAIDDPLGLGSYPTSVVISPVPLLASPVGDVTIEIRCPASAIHGCNGTITIRMAPAPRPHRAAHRSQRASLRVVASRCARGCRPLGSSRFHVRAGSRGRVKVRLAAYGRQLLARRETLPVRVSVTTGSRSNTRTTTRNLILRGSKVAPKVSRLRRHR